MEFFSSLGKITTMKKIFTLALALCAVTYFASAQVQPGIKAGVNIYSLGGDDVDVNSTVGLHFGGLAHIHMSEVLALQPELVFSMQGAKAADNDDARLNLNYLNIPVLLQYMFGDGFRVQAGPQIGFLLSAKQKLDDTSVDVKDGFKSIDFSIPVGISYKRASGFGVDLRYAFGVSNINDGDDKITNGGLQFGVFYQFGQ